MPEALARKRIFAEPSADFEPPKNMTGYIPGHSFGQFMSGLSRAYAVTGDPAIQRKPLGPPKSFS